MNLTGTTIPYGGDDTPGIAIDSRVRGGAFTGGSTVGDCGGLDDIGPGNSAGPVSNAGSDDAATGVGDASASGDASCVGDASGVGDMTGVGETGSKAGDTSGSVSTTAPPVSMKAGASIMGSSSVGRMMPAASSTGYTLGDNSSIT